MGFERWIQTLPLRLRSLFRRRQVEQELDEELQYHLDRLTEEAVAAGRSPEEARYAALRAMRGLEQRKEECRDTWRLTVVHDVLQDLRYAVRTLRRTPTVAGVMVLSLALGIGVNVALFGVLEQALLRPPTAVRPDRLVEVQLGRARQVSFPELLDLAKNGIGATAAYADSLESGRWSGVSETVHCRLVTFNYFDLLGARAAWGRTFAESESAAGGHVAVLAHRFWELRMASDPRALGAPIFVNDEAFTVVGVLPRDFLPVTGPVEVPEIYLPLSPTLPGGLDDRGRRVLFPLLRLPDGMTHRQAEAALATVTARLEREAPVNERRDSGAVRVTGVDTAARLSRHKPELWMACGAVLVMSVLILCIACANVSSVLLARGVARRREIALRLAIGASRGRLVRQLAAETLVVALLASVIALALHAATIGLINHALARSREAVPFAVAPDARLLLYGLGVALVTTLLAGFWPALQATRPALVPALKADVATASLSPSRMRRALVVGQVAASFVLLAVAALFLRSLLVTSRQSLGFDVENTLVAHVNLPRERYEGREPQFFEEAVAKVRGLPDVDSASRTALVPLSFATAGAAVGLEGEAPEAATYTYINVVGPRYFHILGIPVVAGREFDDGDREGAAAAVVVNLAFVRRRIPEGPAIGRRLTVRDGGGRLAATVVGVVGDAKYLWPGEEPRPQVYLSALQAQGIRRVRAIVARTVTPPASTVPALRRALQALEPLAEVRVTTLRAYVDPAFWPSRLAAGLLGAMGALGMLLATIGLFGVMSYAVTSRRQEIGVRMALGATRARVLGTVLRSGLTLVGLGGLAGLGLSLIAPRPLAPLLAAGVAPTDPWSLAAVCALVAAVGAAASLGPAWRASRLDPMRTLRCD